MVPVDRALAADGRRWSRVDTMRAEVAARGASTPAPSIVNDVSGGLADPRDARRRGRARRAVRRDALARPLATDAAAARRTTTSSRDVARRAGRAARRRARRRGRPATGSCSTRASGFAKNAEPQLGAAARASTRCTRSGVPVLVGASPQGVPRRPARRPRTASRGRSTSATPPPPRSTTLAAPAGCLVRARARRRRQSRRRAGRRGLDGRVDAHGRGRGGRRDDDERGLALMAGWTGSRCSGIRAFGHHGVLSTSRRDGQTFVVDVDAGPGHPRRRPRPTTSPTPWTTARSRPTWWPRSPGPRAT